MFLMLGIHGLFDLQVYSFNLIWKISGHCCFNDKLIKLLENFPQLVDAWLFVCFGFDSLSSLCYILDSFYGALQFTNLLFCTV